RPGGGSGVGGPGRGGGSGPGRRRRRGCRRSRRTGGRRRARCRRRRTSGHRTGRGRWTGRSRSCRSRTCPGWTGGPCDRPCWRAGTRTAGWTRSGSRGARSVRAFRAVTCRVLLAVLALKPGGRRDEGGLEVAGPLAGLAAEGVGVEGDLVEVAADAAGGRVELDHGDQVGRFLLLEDELERADRFGEFELQGAVPVVLLLLVVAVFEEVVGQLRRVGVAAGFVVDEGAVVAGPVDADAAPDTAVVPDDRAFGDSAAGLEEFGGFRVGAEGVRHGVDLVEV